MRQQIVFDWNPLLCLQERYSRDENPERCHERRGTQGPKQEKKETNISAAESHMIYKEQWEQILSQSSGAV